MPRPPLPLFLLAFACTLLVSCGANPDIDAMTRAASEPRHVLTAYASVTGVTCVLLYLRGGRDGSNALVDGVRYVSLLSFAVSPFYFLATGDALAGIGMGVSGIVGYVAMTAIKREATARNGPRNPKNRGKKAS